MQITCGTCNGDGFVSFGDRHVENRKEVCDECKGLCMVEARTGEVPQASASPDGTGLYADSLRRHTRVVPAGEQHDADGLPKSGLSGFAIVPPWANEKIDRIAEALWNEVRKASGSITIACTPWVNLTHDAKLRYRKQARTALAAMMADTSQRVADSFGAHIESGVLGSIDGREIGPGHVVLSKERYDWLMAQLPPTTPVAENQEQNVAEHSFRRPHIAACAVSGLIWLAALVFVIHLLT